MSSTLLSSLKALHVVAAILFVGNVIVTGIWTAIFFRARRTHDFRVAARAIVFTDWIFTVGGGALLTLGVTVVFHGESVDPGMSFSGYFETNLWGGGNAVARSVATLFAVK